MWMAHIMAGNLHKSPRDAARSYHFHNYFNFNAREVVLQQQIITLGWQRRCRQLLLVRRLRGITASSVIRISNCARDLHDDLICAIIDDT